MPVRTGEAREFIANDEANNDTDYDALLQTDSALEYMNTQNNFKRLLYPLTIGSQNKATNQSQCSAILRQDSPPQILQLPVTKIRKEK